MRWPTLLGFLVIALIVFFVGLVFNFGYSGTTSIRATNLFDNSRYGDGEYFLAFYPALFGGAKGSPYVEPDGKIEAKYNAANSAKGILNFDRRLARELIYLAEGSDRSDQKCGWNRLPNSQHDRIVLKTDTDSTDKNNPQSTDTTHPDANLQSNSTLKRGVGARITEADYIKCSYKKRPDIQNGCDDQWYKYGKYPILFPNDPNDSLHSGADVLRTVVDQKCLEKIECAVDYYPHLPSLRDNAPGEELGIGEIDPSNTDSPVIKRLNPTIYRDLLTINPSTFEIFASKAAVYKIAQLALQLLATDEPGCEDKTALIWPSEICKDNARKGNIGNVGNCRNIPYTIIFPQWAAKKMRETNSGSSNVWTNFMSIARGEYPNADNPKYKGFPHSLQDESPTAGISYDPVLDTQGLHFNY